eukprot:9697482-Heterocapsa_arctica.AAC.1
MLLKAAHHSDLAFSPDQGKRGNQEAESRRPRNRLRYVARCSEAMDASCRRVCQSTDLMVG